MIKALHCLVTDNHSFPASQRFASQTWRLAYGQLYSIELNHGPPSGTTQTTHTNTHSNAHTNTHTSAPAGFILNTTQFLILADALTAMSLTVSNLLSCIINQVSSEWGSG